MYFYYYRARYYEAAKGGLVNVANGAFSGQDESPAARQAHRSSSRRTQVVGVFGDL